MSNWKTFKTKKTFYCYIKNDNEELFNTESKYRKTGWHLLPNQLIGQAMFPKQIDYIHNNFSRIKPINQTIKIGHSIPLASIAAISSTGGEIVAFNNTLYMLIYKDIHYATINTYNPDIINQCEGETIKDASVQATMLKQYSDAKQSANTDVMFNPFVDDDNIEILYPGNNGCTLTWNVHDYDKHIYKNLSNTKYNWGTSSAKFKANYLPIDERITKFMPSDADDNIKLCLTVGSNDMCYYKNPIPNYLIKLLPIISPSTNKNLPHYCKIMFNIEMTWEGLPIQKHNPYMRVPLLSYQDASTKSNVLIHGQNIISEEHSFKNGEKQYWQKPGHQENKTTWIDYSDGTVESKIDLSVFTNQIENKKEYTINKYGIAVESETQPKKKIKQ